jgi:hypothetical protein
MTFVIARLEERIAATRGHLHRFFSAVFSSLSHEIASTSSDSADHHQQVVVSGQEGSTMAAEVHSTSHDNSAQQSVVVTGSTQGVVTVIGNGSNVVHVENGNAAVVISNGAAGNQSIVVNCGDGAIVVFSQDQ